MVNSIRMLALAGAVALGGISASPLAAQGRQSNARPESIPDSYKPPVGMCRIWVNGVPASQQPAPTDCANAVKNRPANGRVIFGERSEGSKGQPPFLRSFGDKDKPKEKPKYKPRETPRETPREEPAGKARGRTPGAELPGRRP